jgi:hypothetical protein
MGNDNEVSAKFTLEDNVSNTLDGIQNNAIAAFAMITLSAEGLTKVFDKIKEVVGDVMTAFETRQDVLVNTDRILQGLGADATITSDQIKKLSASIGEQTGISETWIQKGINAAIIANNSLANGSDGAIDVLTASAIGLSRITGQDLVPTMETLAKVLDNPATAAVRLRRTGIDLGEQQIEEIKTLVELGDKAGAAAIILNTLAEKTKGAQGAAQTLTEQLKAVQAESEKWKEDLGKDLTPAVLEATKQKTLFYQIMDKIIKGAPALASSYNNVGGVFLSVAKWAATAVQAMSPYLEKIGLIKKANDANTASQVVNNAALDDAEKKQKEVSDAAKKRADDEIARIKKKQADELAADKKFIANKEADQTKYHKREVTDQTKLDKDLNNLANSWGKETKTQSEQIQADLVKIKNDAEKQKADIDAAAKMRESLTTDEHEKELIQIHAAAEKQKVDDSVKASEDKIKAAQMEHDGKLEIEKSFQDLFGELSQLQNSKNRELFEIGKQAAVANAIIHAGEAVMGFWAGSSTMGPAALAMATLETVATGVVLAEQVSSIESQSFPAAAQGALVTPQGGGALVQVGEKAQEAVMNSKMMKDAMRSSQPNVTAVFLPTKHHVAAFTGVSSQSKARMIKEGRLASGA